MGVIELSLRLAEEVSRLEFSDPVTHVYNPLQYAWANHRMYLERFGKAPKRVLFLGMNPGPFGMAQTGVPFGDVQTVREWLKLNGSIGMPDVIHPRRPVEGLKCERIEISGSRLWGWIRKRWKTPAAFFKEHFIVNYCPLVFIEASGKNRTPPRLPKDEREPLEEICDRALSELVEIFRPSWIIGIGNFARDRARELFDGRDIRIGRVLHPSPASPAANRGWERQAEEELWKQGFFGNS